MLETADDTLMSQAGYGKIDEEALLWVRFYKGLKKNEEQSIKEGRPIFDEIDFVRIAIPGDKNSIIDRPVWNDANHPMSDVSRFPKGWAKYKASREQDSQGTPLSQVPWIARAQVEELAYLNCKTVEQLANMPDGNTQNAMGLVGLKRQAQDFLKASKEAAPLAQLRAELDARDHKLQEAEEERAELRKRLSQLEARLMGDDPKPEVKRGRPPKTEAAGV